MIVYNVTCNVQPAMAEEWLNWMKTEHIPEVLATGMFHGYHLYRLITNASDDEGVNYTVQYFCNDMAHYDRYVEEFGPALRQKTWERYGDNVTAWRTLMETV